MAQAARKTPANGGVVTFRGRRGTVKWTASGPRDVMVEVVFDDGRKRMCMLSELDK